MLYLIGFYGNFMGGMFESFAIGGFFTLLFTIGTVLMVIYVYSTEVKKETQRILKEAKEIYSLDYSRLNNIKQIDLTSEHEYFVILKENSNNFFHWRLEKRNVPHIQLELELLDKKFEDINRRVGDGENEIV